MSSSRSIAAARARRTGEQTPPMSGTRPVTSIGSHAAFAPQQNQYQQQLPQNVRTSKGQPPMPPQIQQQVQQQVQQQTNGLPFTKLSISDAIGLITLRLGRVEQFIIDLENGEHPLTGTLNEPSSSILENSKIIDNSVLTTIVNRLDSLEKKETNTFTSEQITNMSLDVKKLQEEIIRFNISINKNNEQILQLTRDVVETKDLLKSL